MFKFEVLTAVWIRQVKNMDFERARHTNRYDVKILNRYDVKILQYQVLKFERVLMVAIKVLSSVVNNRKKIT